MVSGASGAAFPGLHFTGRPGSLGAESLCFVGQKLNAWGAHSTFVRDAGEMSSWASVGIVDAGR